VTDEKPESSVPLIAIIVLGMFLTALAVYLISHWKGKAWVAEVAAEQSALEAASAKRAAMSAAKEAESAKSETAMCRRAIEHADRAVENLETALREERASERSDVMQENEWVKLPDGVNVKELPPGTRLRGDVRCNQYRLLTDGALYVLAPIERLGSLYPAGPLDWVKEVVLPSGHRFEGSEVVKVEPEKKRNGLADALASIVQNNWHNAVHQAQFQGYWGQAITQQCAQDIQQRALAAIANNPNAIGHQFRPAYQQKPKPACACGATTNLRNLSGATYSRHLCGSCYQEQRRAELKAQTKAAIDRPLPKSTAPASWPEQFSSPTWED
jgi:hypothetical protein